MEEKGLELRDYLNVIWKRKKIILTIFLAAVFAATIISFIMPKVYETSIIIKNGCVEEPIIKNEKIKEMIMNSEIINQIISETGIDMETSDILKKNIIKTSDVKNNRSFEVTVQYSNPQKTKKITEIIGKTYVEEGQKLYQQRINLVKRDFETIESMINNTAKIVTTVEDLRNNNENMINNIKNSITKEPETSDKALELKTYLDVLLLIDNSYLNNLTQLSDRNLNLLDRRKNIESILNKAEEFEIISSPSLPKSPISPNMKLNISISGFIALVLGILLAFSQEYLSKTK